MLFKRLHSHLLVLLAAVWCLLSPNGLQRSVTPTVPAQHDRSLRATVVACHALHYDEGPDVPLDRPAHVRAGSGLVWWGSRLAVVQDDARFVALVTPEPSTGRSGHVGALALPAGAGGARVFGEDRGTKHLKLDLEAVAVIPDPGTEVLLAFGSGSSARRERVAVVESGRPPALVEASALYARLREEVGFAGSELNVEGALVVGERLRLFNRGNGAPRDSLQPVNATADIDLRALRDYIGAPSQHDPPPLLAVTRYDLGSLGGLPFGFTDASLTPDGRVLVSMSAEDSPDATRDGRVAGSALGVVDVEEGRPLRLRWAPLRTVAGALFAAKVEGVAPDPANPGRVYVVGDADDPERPTELCAVDLAGPW